MDPLSRLPLECLQRILHLLASPASGPDFFGNQRKNLASLRALAALTRTNKYIAQVTLPFLYRDPVKAAYIMGLGERMMDDFWKLFRLLLLPMSPSYSSTSSSSTSSRATNLHPALVLELQLDNDNLTNATLTNTTTLIGSPSRLDYLHHLDLPFEVFLYLRRRTRSRIYSLLSQYEPYLEDALTHASTSYLSSRASPQQDIIWYCHQNVVLRELIWALACPAMEKLESLSLPVSDLRRWLDLGVIGKLGKLERVCFLFDAFEGSDGNNNSNNNNNNNNVPPADTDTDTDTATATKSYLVREQDIMRAILQFVKQHKHFFPGRLKAATGSNGNFWPYTQNNITPETQRQLSILLPPLPRPTSITHQNWDRIMGHSLETDVSHVKRIGDMSQEQWMHALRTDERGREKVLEILSRCRTLRSLNMMALGRGSFSWAVREKRRWLENHHLGPAGSVVDSNSGGVGSNNNSGGNDLVPLEHVVIFRYNASSNEVDDIAFAFSQTLRSLLVDASNALPGNLPQPVPQSSVLHFGRGWVTLLCLTSLEIRGCSFRRVILDPLLLTHCPNVVNVLVEDGITDYQCQELVEYPTTTTAIAQLPNLRSLDLQGWSALTFHPATLESTYALQRLYLCSGRRCSGKQEWFIPPVVELEQSFKGAPLPVDDNNDQDDETGIQAPPLSPSTATTATLRTRRPAALSLRGNLRPHWSWDWHLPQLRHMELTGEFAFRFQFRMLVKCPSLSALVLDIRALPPPIQNADNNNNNNNNINNNEVPTSTHTRTLTTNDFFLPPSPPLPGQRQHANPTKIEAPSLKHLTLLGHWQISDALLPNLLHGFSNINSSSVRGCVRPGLRQVILPSTTGFTLPRLVECVKSRGCRGCELFVASGCLEPEGEESPGGGTGGEGLRMGLYPRRYPVRNVVFLGAGAAAQAQAQEQARTWENSRGLGRLKFKKSKETTLPCKVFLGKRGGGLVEYLVTRDPSIVPEKRFE